jgi:hypothetical protein
VKTAFFVVEVVMAGLVPAIHVFIAWPKNVDARDKPGQDGDWGSELPYFGRTVGSPPGLPGGGMTGMAPSVLGAGACISGSTPEGGQSTPSDFASLSPSGSRDWPVVVPSGAVARFGRSCGAQSAARWVDGGAVACGGVAGRGGDCAIAALEAAIRRLARMMFTVVRMGGERAGDGRCSRPKRDVIGDRHCEEPLRRSNPESPRGKILDCFAALAMTAW